MFLQKCQGCAPNIYHNIRQQQHEIQLAFHDSSHEHAEKKSRPILKVEHFKLKEEKNAPTTSPLIYCTRKMKNQEEVAHFRGEFLRDWSIILVRSRMCSFANYCSNLPGTSPKDSSMHEQPYEEQNVPTPGAEVAEGITWGSVFEKTLMRGAAGLSTFTGPGLGVVVPATTGKVGGGLALFLRSCK